MGFVLSEIIYLFEKIEKKFNYHIRFLNHLDTVIGDGDHGVNMSNGFKSVRENLSNRNFTDWEEIFKVVGTSLITGGGGAANLLFGTAIIKASNLGVGKSEIDIIDFRKILFSCLEEIKSRGKCEKGDKTILDALIPAIEEIDYGLNNNLDFLHILKNSVDSARSGVEGTKLIVAKKGRAIYLGDRSVGYQDPGATSALMMLEVIQDVVKELRG